MFGLIWLVIHFMNLPYRTIKYTHMKMMPSVVNDRLSWIATLDKRNPFLLPSKDLARENWIG